MRTARWALTQEQLDKLRVHLAVLDTFLPPTDLHLVRHAFLDILVVFHLVLSIKILKQKYEDTYIFLQIIPVRCNASLAQSVLIQYLF